MASGLTIPKPRPSDNPDPVPSTDPFASLGQEAFVGESPLALEKSYSNLFDSLGEAAESLQIEQSGLGGLQPEDIAANQNFQLGAPSPDFIRQQQQYPGAPLRQPTGLGEGVGKPILKELVAQFQAGAAQNPIKAAKQIESELGYQTKVLKNEVYFKRPGESKYTKLAPLVNSLGAALDKGGELLAPILGMAGGLGAELGLDKLAALVKIPALRSAAKLGSAVVGGVVQGPTERALQSEFGVPQEGEGPVNWADTMSGIMNMVFKAPGQLKEFRPKEYSGFSPRTKADYYNVALEDTLHSLQEDGLLPQKPGDLKPGQKLTAERALGDVGEKIGGPYYKRPSESRGSFVRRVNDRLDTQVGTLLDNYEKNFNRGRIPIDQALGGIRKYLADELGIEFNRTGKALEEQSVILDSTGLPEKARPTPQLEQAVVGEQALRQAKTAEPNLQRIVAEYNKLSDLAESGGLTMRELENNIQRFDKELGKYSAANPIPSYVGSVFRGMSEELRDLRDQEFKKYVASPNGQQEPEQIRKAFDEAASRKGIVKAMIKSHASSGSNYSFMVNLFKAGNADKVRQLKDLVQEYDPALWSSVKQGVMADAISKSYGDIQYTKPAGAGGENVGFRQFDPAKLESYLKKNLGDEVTQLVFEPKEVQKLQRQISFLSKFSERDFAPEANLDLKKFTVSQLFNHALAKGASMISATDSLLYNLIKPDIRQYDLMTDKILPELSREAVRKEEKIGYALAAEKLKKMRQLSNVVPGKGGVQRLVESPALRHMLRYVGAVGGVDLLDLGKEVEKIGIENNLNVRRMEGMTMGIGAPGAMGATFQMPAMTTVSPLEEPE